MFLVCRRKNQASKILSNLSKYLKLVINKNAKYKDLFQSFKVKICLSYTFEIVLPLCNKICGTSEPSTMPGILHAHNIYESVKSI